MTLRKSENIIGYFMDKSTGEDIIGPEAVFVAVNYKDANKGNFLYYAPIGQYAEGSIDYLSECKEISKEEYLKLSEGFYTPAEYL